MFHLFKERQWWIAVVLGLIGLVANAFPVELFFRVDFIFGSVATLLALSLLGVGPGLLATAIAASYTIVLWGHPYAALIFLAEAAFVAALMKWRKSSDLILADAAFWLMGGMWLVFLFYGVVMNMETSSTVLIMLKQAVNGILNAFFAALIRLLLNNRFPHLSRQRLTLDQWLTIPVAGLVLLPAVILMILESRSEIRRVEALASQRLELSIRNARDHFNYVYDRRLAVIGVLARHATDESGRFRPTAELQDHLEMVEGLFPEFHNIYVADAQGRAIAFYPETNERGEPTIGHSFADRPYFQELSRTLKPVISEVFMGRAGVFVPIQTINVPVVQGGRLMGYVSGALDLSWMQTYLRRESEGTDLELRLVDKQGRTIASTFENEKMLEPLDLRWETLEPRSTPSLYLLPPRESVLQLLRYSRSWYLSHGLLSEEFPSRIVAQVPVSPYRDALQSAYINNLAMTLGLTSALFLLVRFLIPIFSRPFTGLAEVTKDVPANLVAGKPVSWPTLPVIEFQALVANLQGMTNALQRTFSESETKASQLSRANEELLKEIRHRTRTEKFLRDQNVALLELAQARRETGSLEESLQEISKAAARVLRVSRVSFWFYDEAKSKIICRELFETIHDRHSSGAELLASRYPSYFEALNSQRVIAAGDAVHDPRTAEFGPDYLKPLGIASMLDAPIWVRGKMIGVVCHEHTGTPRTWSTEEGAFAGVIADVVTLALEENERKQTEEQLRARERELQSSQAALMEAQSKLQQHAEQLEQRVQDRTARLQDAVAQMEAFSYTISHDLRAPLRALMGYSQLLQEDYSHQLDEEALDYLRRIQSGAHRLDKLIQDVLTYSRVSGDELHLECVNLDKLVSEIVSEYPGFREAVTVEPPLRSVSGNHAFVTQCLSNLIGNAVKFVKAGERPRVTIRSEQGDGFVRVWVEDNGIGIDPQYHDKVFGVFERIHPGKMYEGTGIGLAIVRKAVERMGGRVGLDSRVGVGSRFWIELPFCES